MTIAAKVRGTDMPIMQQAQVLGFKVAGQLVRRRDSILNAEQLDN